jgi:serine/threonine protein kinase
VTDRHTANNSASTAGQTLPAGYRLEEFVIERVLGSGGFGITYLAHDKSLGRKVVIKENLPIHCSYLDTLTCTVKPRGIDHDSASEFEWAMMNFEREASTLASLEHPNIAKVHRLFQTNQTAYFVMPYVQGVALDTLAAERENDARPFSRDELINILKPLLAALIYLHDQQVFHRDIKPGNILLTKHGIPVLIDFGAARHQLSERSMTVIESPGYTPFEQIRSEGNMGPWSDLYGLGATFYRLASFERPQRSADRIQRDEMRPLAVRDELVRHYGDGLLEIIDRAMAVAVEDRFQSASEMLGVLSESAETGQAVTRTVQRSPMEFSEKLAAKALALRDSGKLAEAATLMDEAVRDWPELRTRYGRMIELWRKGIQM